MSAPAQIDYDALAAQHGGTATVDYDSLAAQNGGQAQPSMADGAHAEIGARKGGLREWLGDLESDLRYGGQQTAVGRALKTMGYQAPQHLQTVGGSYDDAGKTLVSPLTGPVHAASGVVDVASGKPWQGAKEMVSGAAEAATIPGYFIAPGGAKAVSEGASALAPSAMKDAAGQMFQKVMSKAGNFPVDVEPAGQAALKMKTLYERGAGYTPPSVVTRFLNRVTKPDAAPLTYEEARDFYSNATRLSTDEALKLTPKAKAALGNFVQELGSSIQQAANNAGVGGEHAKAMFDYARAMRYADRVDAAKDVATKAIVRGSATAATAYGAKKIWDAAGQ